MDIDLRRLFENDDIKQNFDYEFPADDDMIVGNVNVRGELKGSLGVVSLSATAELTVETQCAKCAKDISRKLNVPIEHLLISHINDEDNDDYILVENMVLELDELVLEDIYLSLPSRFLCRTDCKGLCPYCGQDLNEKDCGCKKPVDPRLAALQQLLSDDE